MLHTLKPGQFVRITDKLLFPVTVLTLILLGIGLYLALFSSPPDYQQGETVRIMYLHVPSAWMSLFIYAIMALASASFLIWKNPLSSMIAKSSAPIGAGFTFITLATGSLWGKPIWGTWWVWDARLTSELVLLFLYIGYIALYGAFDDKERGAKTAAILCMVGVVNLPIIKFSVDWWNTLHQPASIIRATGPKIHESMQLPLFMTIIGFTLLFIILVAIRVKTEVLDKKITRLQMAITPNS